MLRKPGYFRWQLTQACNLRCSFCHGEGAGSGTIRLHAGRAGHAAILSFLSEINVGKLKFLGGEPLLYPGLPDLVAMARSMLPGADLSLITNGTLDPARLARCLHAGLNRANISIHGWTAEAFAVHGGTEAMRKNRFRNIRMLVDRNLPVKLNYVYIGPEVEPDLLRFLQWAATMPVTVNVLDRLGDPAMSHRTIHRLLHRFFGMYTKKWTDIDPYSLPTTRYLWRNGLEVEVKTSELRDMAPWRACNACHCKPVCREGIYAARITSRNTIRLCMDRKDMEFDLADNLRQAPTRAAKNWNMYLRENINDADHRHHRPPRKRQNHSWSTGSPEAGMGICS